MCHQQQNSVYHTSSTGPETQVSSQNSHRHTETLYHLEEWIFLCKLFFILTNCLVGKICLDNWFLGSSFSFSLEISLWVPGTVWICLVGSKMVEKLLCRFQERCRGALWDSDRFRNCFLRSRIVLELLCGLQAWLINRFFWCSTVGLEPFCGFQDWFKLLSGMCDCFRN